ncbi:MAG: nucleoside triphosphate pyrophosphohydrolase family protein [Streptococcaceae bacterium]|nr:nucleoside triphosphate pyrophosphohydrolase family protein [Streptococcaceae bacterium]MCL2858726.1 nucleoside triphosphate pyrophosphohydrolase family protein [Streptococcaceae bacterium]
MKTLNDYQEEIVKFDVHGNRRDIEAIDLPFLDKVLGLSGEAGEVSDKVKKLIRDKDGRLTSTDKENIAKELGDVLWYVATTARYIGIDLENIAKNNIEKLEDRKARGVIKGNGDNR